MISGMTDIGDLFVPTLVSAYLAAYLLRAPKWLQLTIAVPTGVASVWALTLGLHVYVATDVGHPLSKVAPVVALVALLVGVLFDHFKRRPEARRSTTEAKD